MTEPKVEFTSTDRKLLYRVRFTPSGDVHFVEAGNAASAQAQVATPSGTIGVDIHLASKNEITDFYADDKEEE